MRASFSPIENTFDTSITPENDERFNEKPKREIHRRSQRAFDLQEAQALKVMCLTRKKLSHELCFQNQFDQSFKNKISQLTIFDKRDETAGEPIDLIYL